MRLSRINFDPLEGEKWKHKMVENDLVFVFDEHRLDYIYIYINLVYMVFLLLLILSIYYNECIVAHGDSFAAKTMNADSFAAKRMRKIVHRRAVDYTSTVVRYMQVSFISHL